MGKTGKVLLLIGAGLLGAALPVYLYVRLLQPSVHGVPPEAPLEAPILAPSPAPQEELSVSNLALGANPPLLVLGTVTTGPRGLVVGGPVLVQLSTRTGNQELSGTDLERFWGALPRDSGQLAFAGAQVVLDGGPALEGVGLELRRVGPRTVLTLDLPGARFGQFAELEFSWTQGGGFSEVVLAAQGLAAPGMDGATVGFAEARLEGRVLTLREFVLRDPEGRVLLAADQALVEAPRRFLRELLAGLRDLDRPATALDGLELSGLRLAGGTATLGLVNTIFGQPSVLMERLEARRLWVRGDAVKVEGLRLRFGPLVLEARSLEPLEGGLGGGAGLKGLRLELPLGLDLRAPAGRLEISALGRPALALEGATLAPAGGTPGLLAFAARMAGLKSAAGQLATQFDGSSFPSLETLTTTLGLEQLGATLEALDLTCKGCNLEAGLVLKGVDFLFGHDAFGNALLGLSRGTEAEDLLSAQAVFTPDGAFREAELRLSGPRFSAWVARQVPGHLLKEGALAARLHFAPKGGLLRFDGEFSATEVALEHLRLAAWPIHLDPLSAQFGGELDPHTRSVSVDLPRLELGEVFWSVNLKFGWNESVPAVDFALVFPKQDCGKMLKALPRELIPRLGAASLKGPLEYKLRFAVDLRDVRASLRFDVKGDWDKCELGTLGPELDVEKLNEPDFIHRVVVEGEDLGIDVGPGTDSYVPLHAIPLHVQAAAWGTEDLAFFKHQGFKLGLMRRALILFLERGRFVYGGSTVSQQLVKNLFMYREKSLSRKFEEAVITWAMERKVPKDRILELYLNCIEFGPKIWGIKQAAKVYFDKAPEALTPLEASFIMGLKPDPLYGFLQYRRGKVNEQWKGNLKRVMDRLHFQMGVITAEQYAAESHLQPAFAAFGRFKTKDGLAPPETVLPEGGQE
jgi:hypothetical protein